MEKKDASDEDFYASKKHWNDYTNTFIQVIEYSLMHSSVAIYSHTRAFESKKILDAGWGSGKSSMMMINTFMKPGTVLYCSDISDRMIETFAKSFESSDLSKSDKIKFKVLKESESIDIEEPEEDTKKVFLTIANNRKLPFSDESFDTYLSNHCLQYVDDPQAHIREAYRVLQKGGKLGIAVGGRMEKAEFWFTLEEVMKIHDIEIEHKCRIFSLGDKDKLKALFKDEGFTNIKIMLNIMYFIGDAHEIFRANIFFDPYKNVWEKLSDEKKDQVYKSFIQLFEERYGKSSENSLEGEMYIVTAEKK